MKTKNYNIPIFIPELACPHQCVFCNQKKISGQQKMPSVDDIQLTIENHLSTIDTSNSKTEIAFFGGNFTGINYSDQVKYLEAVKKYSNYGVKGIRISTRPDYISNEILLNLKYFNVTSIELGAQSFDADVLKSSGRGHSVNSIYRASRLIHDFGFELGLQMMIGLPGDSLEKSIFTANEIIKLRAKTTRIYPTLVIKNTALANLFFSGKYNPLSINESIIWLSQLIPIFEKSNVNILRVGLHPTEGLLNGNDLVAGPFHQSIREMAYSNIWKNILFNSITQKSNSILIEVAPSELNYAIGYKSENRKLLLEIFKNVTIKPKASLTNRNFNAIYY